MRTTAPRRASAQQSHRAARESAHNRDASRQEHLQQQYEGIVPYDLMIWTRGFLLFNHLFVSLRPPPSTLSHTSACSQDDLPSSSGMAWALLGLLRLKLVAPSAGIDPAARPALARDSLLTAQETSLKPELEVGKA